VHRNRVTPLGELIADPARGLVYGNRGCLHDDEGTIRRHHNGRRWISCLLEFQGRRRRPLLPPGRYTGLFFLDEATAFAAGHRPCAYCRRPDYERFVRSFPGPRGADAIDLQLHAERLDGKTQRHHVADLDELPDGAFVLHDDAPHLVLGNELLEWTPAGYRTRVPRPHGRATLITPPSIVDVLRLGWTSLVPVFHPSADAALPHAVAAAPRSAPTRSR
jgi:hypothetical protein